MHISGKEKTPVKVTENYKTLVEFEEHLQSWMEEIMKKYCK